MGEQIDSFNVKVAPIGAGYERELTDRENTVLKRLLVGTGEPECDYLLASFAGFMASRMIDDKDEYPGESEDEYVQKIGDHGAQYALRLRSYATEDQWPEDVSPAGFVYDLVERWFVYHDQGDVTHDGLSLRDYFHEDRLWEKQNG